MKHDCSALAAAVLTAAACFCSPGLGRAEGPASAEASPRASLGRAIFFDRRLSDPPGTSCASCHDPARAFSGDNGSHVGVPAGSRPGVLARRTAPSLLYLRFVPRFRFGSEDEDNHAAGYGPYGGFFWDGRSDSLAGLVRQPLLNPREMNNRDAAEIAAKLRAAPYAGALAAEFPGALGDDEGAVEALGAALEAFLRSPAMAPFSSRYDDYVRGVGTLTAEERRGLALFKDRRRAGCSECHKLEDRAPDPTRSMFTDYGYDAAGAPRNARLPAHEDDLGVCERRDASQPSNDAQYCASFRTPSLRNVALRPAFMHNGAFTRLRDVVAFYASRDTDPRRWYPSGVSYDDTPPAYRGQVNVTAVPYNRKLGAPPALDDGEIDAIVAFLRTLTDRRR